MSTDFRATQMQAGKYIRFVSTQALRARARKAKRRHYRIIARTRTHDGSLASALARSMAKRSREQLDARCMCAPARKCAC
jgi:hypothetical protein